MGPATDPGPSGFGRISIGQFYACFPMIGWLENCTFNQVHFCSKFSVLYNL
ncbi:unnamed protein product [Staurois parvus]|uniref:Uncharacterized protein n=1 Tax=Staurois parvus TaxID=386267 RepID=A0ABN9GPF1_9NEOB|nr:unnamed protein product [Staurois parvus]